MYGAHLASLWRAGDSLLFAAKPIFLKLRMSRRIFVDCFFSMSRGGFPANENEVKMHRMIKVIICSLTEFKTVSETFQKTFYSSEQPRAQLF